MESKTILVVSHDHTLREQMRDVLARKSPALKVVEYVLGGRAVAELKRLSVDLLIMGDELLDGDCETLVSRARLQMPLLPIIIVDSDHSEPPTDRPMQLRRFVPKGRIDELLVPAILALLHNDRLVRRPEQFAA